MNATRTEEAILDDLSLVNQVLENLRPEASPAHLNEKRKALEAELVVCRMRARTASLHPRSASILMGSPLFRPMLEAGDYGDPQDMSLEALPGYPRRAKAPREVFDQVFHEDLQHDARRDRIAELEGSCQE